MLLLPGSIINCAASPRAPAPAAPGAASAANVVDLPGDAHSAGPGDAQKPWGVTPWIFPQPPQDATRVLR